MIPTHLDSVIEMLEMNHVLDYLNTRAVYLAHMVSQRDDHLDLLSKSNSILMLALDWESEVGDNHRIVMPFEHIPENLKF